MKNNPNKRLLVLSILAALLIILLPGAKPAAAETTAKIDVSAEYYDTVTGEWIEHNDWVESFTINGEATDSATVSCSERTSIELTPKKGYMGGGMIVNGDMIAINEIPDLSASVNSETGAVSADFTPENGKEYKIVFAIRPAVTVTYDLNGGTVGDDWHGNIRITEKGRKVISISNPICQIIPPDGTVLRGVEITDGNGTFTVYAAKLEVTEYTYDSDVTFKCIWGEAPKKISVINIDNIWTDFDSAKPVSFTTEIHDASDEDGVNFRDKMEIDTEAWEGAGERINRENPTAPKEGATYKHIIELRAEDGWAFDKEFTLIYNGRKVTGYNASVSYMGYSIHIKNLETATATNQDQEEDASVSQATVSGVKSKTYTGKPVTQKLTVTINANGKSVTLQEGRDYTISYKNNVNAGNASVIIKGAGNYTGKTSVTFKINKAKNPLNIKAKNAKASYKKLKKSSQKLSVKKVISFKHKGQGKMSYTRLSGSKNLSINKKTGMITVKKGTRRGTYSIKVKVKAAGDSNYKPSPTKKITIKVKVK